MATEVTIVVRCDGCGKKIPGGGILPVALLDENRNDIHFCDHLCLIPYANRRHSERLGAVRDQLSTNVEQITANLADAKQRATSGDPQEAEAGAREAGIIEPFLEPAQQALADHDAAQPDTDPGSVSVTVPLSSDVGVG